MIGWWVAAGVFAGALAGGSQRTHELEWSRESPLAFATELPGSDPGERVAIARALGRLRSADALDLLGGLRSDADDQVRVAAAEALAFTPGSVPLVREWLGALDTASGPYARARAAGGEAVALLGALGHQGGSEEVAVLREALREPWPIGGSAARALGRMAIRKVPGVSAAIPDLCARLDGTDPRTVADVAWALSRVGLEGAVPDDLARVVRRIEGGGTYETTRAWLYKAGWAHLDDPVRDRLFIEGMTDPSRLVRVAVLTALRAEDVAADVLSSWLADPDPWIRLAAVDAIGREGSPEAVEILLRRSESAAEPYARAAAIRAAGKGAAGKGTGAPFPAARIAAARA